MNFTDPAPQWHGPVVSPRPKQPRRISELGALRIAKPDEWARKVRREVKTAEGYLGPAAEALNVSVRTLQRWLAEDDALEDVRGLVASRVGQRRDR